MNTYAPKAIDNPLHPVWVGAIFKQHNLLRQFCSSKICIISDETVAPLYLNTIQELLAGKEVLHLVLPAGEQQKNWQQLEKILSFLTEYNMPRSTTLIALGGGTITDLTGLAASLFMRGIDWIALPTTLLAQVDAAIAGKTAINFAQHKNMIGAFYSPKAILLEPTTLKSLPEQEYLNGFAEAIKHALIADLDFFVWLEKNAGLLLTRDLITLTECISKNIAIKINIAAKDLHDHGHRHLLNAGHTIGHALEAASAFTLSHGAAVAIGLVMEIEFANKYYQSETNLERVKTLLQRFNLPTQLPAHLSLEDALKHLVHDKKINHEKIKFPLITQIGKAQLQDLTLEEFCQQLSCLN